MNPMFNILSSTTGYDTSNPTLPAGYYLDAGTTGRLSLFVEEYFNGDRGQTIQMPELTTTIATAPAFDEGGNFIDVRFGPLTLRKIPCPALPASCLYGDYHLRPIAANPALAAGGVAHIPLLVRGLFIPNRDFDNQVRPSPALSRPDIGAEAR
jgi:hypothetical protein